jgi:hypothetical protein
MRETKEYDRLSPTAGQIILEQLPERMGQAGKPAFEVNFWRCLLINKNYWGSC